MKIKSLKHLTFQRNGVHREGFYHAIVTTTEDKGRNFVVNFQSHDSGDLDINIPSCRVVCIEQPRLKWRGDKFAYALHDYFKQKAKDFPHFKNLYDFTTNQYQQTFKKWDDENTGFYELTPIKAKSTKVKIN